MKQYAILEHKYGDTFDTVLPVGTSEEKAIEKANITYCYLTSGERNHTTVELGFGYCVNGVFDISCYDIIWKNGREL